MADGTRRVGVEVFADASQADPTFIKTKENVRGIGDEAAKSGATADLSPTRESGVHEPVARTDRT